MKLNKIKIDIILFLVLIWVITFSILFFINEDTLLEKIYSYMFVLYSLSIAVFTMIKAIKKHHNEIVLYGALGFFCLAIGNLYLMLIDIVGSPIDNISVGNFSKICCYLFFISALIGLKKEKTAIIKKLYSFFIIVSVIATICCIYATITNITTIMIIAVVLLDSLCLITSSFLFKDKKILKFSLSFFILALIDIISIFNSYYYISILTSAMSPVLYLIIARSLVNLKLGDKHD